MRYASIKDSGCDNSSATATLGDGTSFDGGHNGSCWNFGVFTVASGGGVSATEGAQGSGPVQTGGGAGGGTGGNPTGGSGGGGGQSGGGGGGGAGGGSP